MFFVFPDPKIGGGGSPGCAPKCTSWPKVGGGGASALAIEIYIHVYPLHPYIYVYIYICVCVCICILKHLRRWRLQGRPFVNSDLLLQLQAEVDARTAPTLWRHVYSHIGVAGNERADELANQGRLAHPRRRQFLRDQAEAAGRPSVVVRTACRAP